MLFNKSGFIKIMSFLCGITGVSMLMPAFVSAFYHEDAVAKVFMLTSAICIGLGLATLLLMKDTSPHLNNRDGMLIVFFGWLMMSVIGALPYMLTGVTHSFAAALFEAVSGFTTTGATVFVDIEALPKGILFWRSMCHWLGGMGILVFLISILPILDMNTHNLIKAETPGPEVEKLSAKHHISARLFYIAYTVITLALFFALLPTDMSAFDAAIFTLGSAASGGLTNYNDGLMHFSSNYIRTVLAITMILSCVNFSLYYYLVKGEWDRIRKNTELRVFLAIMVVTSVLVTLNLAACGTYDFPEAARQGVFHTVSFATTTGLAGDDFMAWPTFSKMILTLVPFIGGCSASTGGALKVIRVVIVGKLIWRSFYIRIHPVAVKSIKIAGKPVPSSVINSVVAFVLTYVFIFLFGAFVISFDTADFTTSFTASAALLNNTGIGVGDMGLMGCYASFADPTKLFMCLLMLAGRLEIYTVMLIGSRDFWNPHR